VATLVNPATCVLLAAAVIFAARGARGGLGSFARWLERPAVTTALAVLAAAHVIARIGIGIVAPGDFAGEIVAARAWRSGGALYSADIAADSRAVVDEAPDAFARAVERSVPPGLRPAIEARRHTRLVAQAHPPTLLAGWVLLIALVGTSGAFLLASLASVVAAAWLGWCLAAWVPASGMVIPVVVLVIAWQPVLASIRDGQVSTIVAALSVGAWGQARRGRANRAGVLAGIAAVAKLYPALLLLALVRDSRRAALSAVVFLLAAAAATTLVVGADAWAGYFSAARSVTAGHWNTLGSLSLLARFGQVAGRPVAVAAWLASGVLLLALTILADRRDRPGDPAGAFDLSFARFCCLAVLLPPVAWHHYAVLLVLPLAVAWRRAWVDEDSFGLWIVMISALVLSLPVAETSGMGLGVSAAAPPVLAVVRSAIVLILWFWLVRVRPAGSRAPVLR
jgi:hypothetical protein